MSDEMKGSNMFESENIVKTFVENISYSLDRLCESENMEGCLKLIQFTRRYIQDLPLSSYRISGDYKSITDFVDLCGLKNGTDYEIACSNLDETSSVFSFSNTEKSSKFIGVLHAFRVKKGPSVCDRLYCEMSKEPSDRNFERIFDDLDQAETYSVINHVIDRTYEIYSTLSKVTLKSKSYADENSIDLLEDGRIIEFVKSQISENGLTTASSPVVPPAVAECFYRMNCKDNDVTVSVFKLGNNASEWCAFRPINATFEGKIPDVNIPVQIMRRMSRNFDRYMPTDSYSFLEADETSDTENNAVLMVSGSPIRFPKDSTSDTEQAISILKDKSRFMSYLCGIYRFCYPHLDISFLSTSGLKLSVSSVYAEIDKNDYRCQKEVKDLVFDESKSLLQLNESSENPGIAFVGTAVLSPFVSFYKCADFPKSHTVSVSFRIKDNKDKKTANSQESAIGKRWFEIIHNYEAPDFNENTEEKDIKKFFCYSVEKDFSGCLSGLIASAIRSAIYKCKSKLGMDEKSVVVQYVPENEMTAFNRHGRFVTQLMSYISGSSTGSLTTFLSNYEVGSKTSIPNMIPSGTTNIRFVASNLNSILEFSKILNNSTLQLNSPRKPKTFGIVAETNISFSDIYSCCCSNEPHKKILFDTLNDNLMRCLLPNIYTNGESWKHIDRITRISGKTSIMSKIANAAMKSQDMSDIATECFKYGFYKDKYGRTFIVVNIVPAVAFLSMICKETDDEKVEDLIRLGVKYDDSIVYISENDWKSDICKFLFSNKELIYDILKNNSSSTDHYLETAPLYYDITPGDLVVKPSIYMNCVIRDERVSEKFSHCDSNRTSAIDPN